jgi:hypothetical protein
VWREKKYCGGAGDLLRSHYAVQHFLLADQAGGVENYIGQTNVAAVVKQQSAGPKHPKIMMWQGGADNLIPTGDSINIYRTVATAYGNGTTDFAGLSSWFRYYRAPGVGHCGSGTPGLIEDAGLAGPLLD